ncbi:MAG: hypothetical protein NVS3B17_23870 [Vulcanimicrobiaceae bacterium]
MRLDARERAGRPTRWEKVRIMNSRPLPLLFALLAAAAAAVFLAISIDREIYAPGAGRLEGHFGIMGAIGAHFPQIYEHDMPPVRILRKIYSVGAFAVVAFFASPLFGRRTRVIAGAALLTAFSGAIEVAQRFITHNSNESNLSSLFDLACGAIGGLIGALAWNLVTDVARRRAPDAS